MKKVESNEKIFKMELTEEEAKVLDEASEILDKIYNEVGCHIYIGSIFNNIDIDSDELESWIGYLMRIAEDKGVSYISTDEDENDDNNEEDDNEEEEEEEGEDDE